MSGGGSFVLGMFLLQSSTCSLHHIDIGSFHKYSHHHTITTNTTNQYAPLPSPLVHPFKMDDLLSTQNQFAFFPPPCQLFLTHWHPQTSLFLTSALEKTIRLRRGSGARGGSGSGMSPSQKSVGWLYFGVSDHVLGRKITDFLLSSSTR